MQKIIHVNTRHHDDFVDITREIYACVKESSLEQGIVTVFIPHTTAGITIQENADPPLKNDITNVFARLFPWNDDYGHGEDNAAAHMKAMLVGPSVQIPFTKNKMQLGTWQSIYFCEFDGPRHRKCIVQVG